MLNTPPSMFLLVKNGSEEAWYKYKTVYWTSFIILLVFLIEYYKYILNNNG